MLLEAPVLRAAVVYVDPDLLPPDLRSRLTQPYHVGFTYGRGKNFTAADYPAVSNSSALAAAAVLLAWLQVGDQEGHNQYLFQMERPLPDGSTEKMSRFLLVDLAAICGSHNWSGATLDNPGASYRLPPHLKAQLTLQAVEELVERIQDLDYNEIHSCLMSYPREWGISVSFATKLGRFLYARRRRLPDIMREIFA